MRQSPTQEPVQQRYSTSLSLSERSELLGQLVRSEQWGLLEILALRDPPARQVLREAWERLERLERPGQRGRPGYPGHRVLRARRGPRGPWA